MITNVLSMIFLVGHFPENVYYFENPTRSTTCYHKFIKTHELFDADEYQELLEIAQEVDKYSHDNELSVLAIACLDKTDKYRDILRRVIEIAKE